jgi:uracil-DNA glycosylase
MTDIMLVGEAWGEKEEELGKPFVGPSGFILDGMLAQAGIARRDCYLTNVFNFRPHPSNDIKNVCGPKTTGISGYPALQQGKYVRAEYAPELLRLGAEIRRERPNLIIALGATASWAILHTSGIKAIRGSVSLAPGARFGLDYSVKVLPTYHPAAVARQWNLRPVVIADLDKARRHSGTRDYSRPTRHIWIKPTLEDIAEYEQRYILPASSLTPDIETKQDQITCIGFAPNPTTAIVIPFFGEDGRSYWSLGDEVGVWGYVRRWLAMKPLRFQNGLYDMNFLWAKYGIPCPTAAEDTMLLHHAFQPEMEKGLGFLGSIYTDEPSWKFMIKGTKKHD